MAWKYTTLKKTDIQISIVGLGTNSIQGENGKELVLEALRQGVTFFDTADVYMGGDSEELLGEVLKPYRNEVVIATKGGIVRSSDGTSRYDNRPKYLRTALENSLKRLKTDYVDLYYIHFPDPNVPLSESVGELTRLKEEGKIRAIGISNVNFEQLKQANEHHDISALQAQYNMFQRSVEQDLLPYCAENDISFIPYGPLAYGLLGGGLTKDYQPETAWRKKQDLFQPGVFENNLAKVEKLKEFAAEKKMTIANLALAWLLHQKGLDAVIPGGKTANRIKENALASEITLTEADLQKVDSILQS